MARYLHDLRIHEGALVEQLRGVAGTSTNRVADAFTEKLRLPAGGVASVVVELTDDPEAHGRTVRRLDVVSVEAHLDPAVLTGATPEVDRALARLAHDALATVVEPAALAELAAVHERAVARLADFSGPLSTAVRDRSTRRVARLFFRYTDRIDVLCHVSGPSEEDEREILLFRHPAALAPLRALLGRPVWADDGTLVVPRAGTEDRWVVDPRAGTADLRLARAEAGQPHGMYQLSRMYRDGDLVLTDPARARSWLERAAAAGHVPAVRALARADEA